MDPNNHCDHHSYIYIFVSSISCRFVHLYTIKKNVIPLADGLFYSQRMHVYICKVKHICKVKPLLDNLAFLFKEKRNRRFNMYISIFVKGIMQKKNGYICVCLTKKKFAINLIRLFNEVFLRQHLHRQICWKSNQGRGP